MVITSDIILVGDYNIPRLNITNITENLTNERVKQFVKRVPFRLMALFIRDSILQQHNIHPNHNNRILDLVLSPSDLVVSRVENPLIRADPHHPALVIELTTDATVLEESSERELESEMGRLQMNDTVSATAVSEVAGVPSEEPSEVPVEATGSVEANTEAESASILENLLSYQMQVLGTPSTRLMLGLLPPNAHRETLPELLRGALSPEEIQKEMALSMAMQLISTPNSKGGCSIM